MRHKKKLTDLTAKSLFDRIAGTCLAIVRRGGRRRILPASKGAVSKGFLRWSSRLQPQASPEATPRRGVKFELKKSHTNSPRRTDKNALSGTFDTAPFHRSFVIASTINLITGIAINFVILFSFSFSSHAEEEKKALFDAYVILDSKTEIAIQRAQAWIAGIQCADGSWNTRYGRNNTGEIALAILALMVNGTVPGEGKYSKEIGRGIQFLLNSQKESGLIAGAPDSQAPMYQHALATIALAESYGMTSNPRIRTVLIKAVNLIVEVQDSAGGWRYQPRIERGDISASVMQVMALRASAEAGIYISDDTIERAIRFIKGCYNPTEKGFGYMGGFQHAAFPRTGAGLVSLQSVGLHDDPIVPDVVKYLLDNGFNQREDHHYWYGHYYTSIALYHYGGAPWENYYPKIKGKILSDWAKSGHHNDLLVTSWAVLILGVPYRYLPIYQR